MMLLKSILLFGAAGLCEIVGGYFVWIWSKSNKSWGYGLAGMLLLVLYGFVPTLQTSNFGRVYAAYGGVFVTLSLLWGWKIDNIVPDKFDIYGSVICLLGVAIMMQPRK